MKKTTLLGLLGCSLLASPLANAVSVWGVDPTATNQIINIDPFTGAVNASFSLGSSYIGASDTDIGLAGWSNNTLFYTDANRNNGTIYTLDTSTGSVVGSYTVSGGWEINGLGYFRNASGSWIYTSGCSVNDVHRYNATNGASPNFYWSNVSNPLSMAGDNGGKIFTAVSTTNGTQIYELDPLADTNATYFAASPSSSIVGMAYDGTYLYLSDTDGYLYTMNNAGELVNTLSLGYTLYALGSTEGSGNVPEPAAALLVAAGLFSLSLTRRGRKS